VWILGKIDDVMLFLIVFDVINDYLHHMLMIYCSGAIQCCRPGGVIVYSTCTLAPTQNDGVVSATLERIWQETKIGVVAESIGEITDRFSRIFTFQSGGMPGSRYGCLVLPKLTENFGPMYFCRLRRTN